MSHSGLKMDKKWIARKKFIKKFFIPYGHFADSSPSSICRFVWYYWQCQTSLPPSFWKNPSWNPIIQHNLVKVIILELVLQISYSIVCSTLYCKCKVSTPPLPIIYEKKIAVCSLSWQDFIMSITKKIGKQKCNLQLQVQFFKKDLYVILNFSRATP